MSAPQAYAKATISRQAAEKEVQHLKINCDGARMNKKVSATKAMAAPKMLYDAEPPLKAAVLRRDKAVATLKSREATVRACEDKLRACETKLRAGQLKLSRKQIA